MRTEKSVSNCFFCTFEQAHKKQENIFSYFGQLCHHSKSCAFNKKNIYTLKTDISYQLSHKETCFGDEAFDWILLLTFYKFSNKIDKRKKNFKHEK